MNNLHVTDLYELAPGELKEKVLSSAIRAGFSLYDMGRLEKLLESGISSQFFSEGARAALIFLEELNSMDPDEVMAAFILSVRDIFDEKLKSNEKGPGEISGVEYDKAFLLADSVSSGIKSASEEMGSGDFELRYRIASAIDRLLMVGWKKVSLPVPKVTEIIEHVQNKILPAVRRRMPAIVLRLEDLLRKVIEARRKLQ